MSQEDFFQSALPKIEYFKLRGSIGTLGNDNVTAFLYRKQFAYNASSVAFGSTPASQGTLSNSVAFPFEDLTWERTRTYDIGFEMSAWNGLLGVEFDYFYKYTFNILQSIGGIYPPSLGGHYPAYIRPRRSWPMRRNRSACSPVWVISNMSISTATEPLRPTTMYGLPAAVCRR